MKNVALTSVALFFGLLIGFAAARTISPTAAIAQTSAPMPMGNGMSGHGMMSNCPAMQGMMGKAKSAADREMMQSMMSMHQSMQSMQLTGNPDSDYLIMMIPHHKMAIAMSNVELKNGKDAKVQALAKSIIAAQQHEIDQMQSWLP